MEIGDCRQATLVSQRVYHCFNEDFPMFQNHQGIISSKNSAGSWYHSTSFLSNETSFIFGQIRHYLKLDTNFNQQHASENNEPTLSKAGKYLHQLSLPFILTITENTNLVNQKVLNFHCKFIDLQKTLDSHFANIKKLQRNFSKMHTMRIKK